VKDKFYYYTTIRRGSRTKSVYLGKSFSEAKKKEQQLISKTSPKTLKFNWRALSLVMILLLIFGTGTYYNYTTSEEGSFFSKLFALTGFAILETTGKIKMEKWLLPSLAFLALLLLFFVRSFNFYLQKRSKGEVKK